MANKECLLFCVVLIAFCANYSEVSARSLNDGIRSDVIETKFGADDEFSVEAQNKPGWMRRQLMRFGDIASSVSNRLGGTGLKVAAIIEKLCKMLKTVIPIVAAVCHVGQFQFCSMADAPTQLAEELAKPNPLDLNMQD